MAVTRVGGRGWDAPGSDFKTERGLEAVDLTWKENGNFEVNLHALSYGKPFY